MEASGPGDAATPTMPDDTSEQGSSTAMAGLVEAGSRADAEAEANQLSPMDSETSVATCATGVEASVASKPLVPQPKIMRWAAANALSGDAESLQERKFERLRQRKLVRKHQSWKLRIAASIMDDDLRTSTHASEWVNQVSRKIVTIQRTWREALARKKREKTMAMLNDAEKPPLVKNGWGWQMENDPWKILLMQSASTRLLEQVQAYESDSDDSSLGSDYDSSEYSHSDSSEDEESDEEDERDIVRNRVRMRFMAAAKATRAALGMLGMDRVPRSKFQGRGSSRIFKVSASVDRPAQLNPWSPSQSLTRKSLRNHHWGLLRALGPDLTGRSSRRVLQDRAGGSTQEPVGGLRQNPDGPLSLVSTNSHSRFKAGKAEAFNDRLTYIRNEVMAVKGGNVSQWQGSRRASDTILQRTKMAAMGIRTTKLAVQDMVAALGLDVNSLSPEDIEQIIRCSMNAKWRMTVLKNTLGDSRKGMVALRANAGVADLLDFPVKNFFDMQASAKKRDTSRLRDAGKRLRHLEEVLGNVGTEVNSFLKDMKRKAAVRSAAGRGSAHKKDSPVAAEAAGDLTFRTCDSGSSIHPAERPPLAASAAMLGGQKSANVVTLPSLGFRALKQGPMDPENDIPIGARSIDELQRQSGMGTCGFGEQGAGGMGKRLSRINHNVGWNVQRREPMPELYSLACSRQPKHMPPFPEKTKRRRIPAPAPTVEKAGATFVVGRINARSHMESAVRFARAANHELAKRMERAHWGLDDAKELPAADSCATSTREPRKPKTVKVFEPHRLTSCHGMVY